MKKIMLLAVISCFAMSSAFAVKNVFDGSGHSSSPEERDTGERTK